MKLPKLSFLEGIEWKPIAAGAGTIVGLFIWWQLFLGPQRNELTDLQRRSAAMSKDAALFKEKFAKLPQMEKELAEMAGQYDARMVTTLPEEQLPELFEVIAEAARAADVRLQSVKSKAEVSKLSPSSSGFLELPVQIDAEGGYHQLGVFLDKLEASRALVRVHELKIEANSEDIWRHQATFVLWAYLFPAGEKPKQ